MKRLYLLMTIALMFCASTAVRAQMQIKGNVVLINDDNSRVKSERMYFGMFKDYKEAQKADDELKRIFNRGNSGDAMALVKLEEDVKNARLRYSITSTTQRDGSFRKNVMAGMALLFLNVTDYTTKIIMISSSQTEYKDIEIRVHRKAGVNVEGRARPQPTIGGGVVGDPDDGYEYFPIRFNLPVEAVGPLAKEDARLIVQTYAVDCQTEDTFAYCQPVVIEGTKYHEMQDRRMGFDFMQNDKLAAGYDSMNVLIPGEDIEVNTVVKYKKPEDKKDNTFKGPFTFVIEDYHHVYYQGGWEGTCLREKPFKLVDFTPAMAEMELTEEFKEEAETQFEDKTTDLQLRFVMGTNELTTDSINTVELNRLSRELRLYGDKIVKINITGTSSPDGSLKRNEELARQRADRARQMLPALSVRPTIDSRVYTWSDVASDLRRKGKVTEAEAVANLVEIGPKDDILLSREMKELPFYEQEVLPVLENQRVMKCKYQVIRDYVMNAEECKDAYYGDKRAFLEGRRVFSNGDYYNLFDIVTDSTDLDTITMLAYQSVIHGSEYWIENKIAPFVCNRMAVMQMKRGVPNSSILAPFIDYSRQKIGQKVWVDELVNYTSNRAEILLNQAVCYYMDQKLDSCQFMIDWLKREGKSTPALDKLEKFMKLRKLHFLRESRSAQQELDYQEAKTSTLATSDENKAILYTEIPDWGMRDQAMQWVDAMDDNNPKKWYLKGLLWVDKAGKEDKLEDPETVRRKQAEAEAAAAKRDPLANRPDIGGGYKLLTADERMDLQFSPDPADQEKYKGYMEQLNKYMQEHDGVVPEIKEEETDQPGAVPEGMAEDAEDDDYEFKGIPYYLVYFQHSFDLEPKYKRMYFNEGHIGPDMRRKYSYKKANIPLYRRMFQLLREQDKKARREALEKQGKDVEDDDAPEEENNSTEPGE